MFSRSSPSQPPPPPLLADNNSHHDNSSLQSAPYTSYATVYTLPLLTIRCVFMMRTRMRVCLFVGILRLIVDILSRVCIRVGSLWSLVELLT